MFRSACWRHVVGRREPDIRVGAALRITAFCGAPQIGADAALPSYVSTRTSYDAFPTGRIVLPRSEQNQDAFFHKQPCPSRAPCKDSDVLCVGNVSHSLPKSGSVRCQSAIHFRRTVAYSLLAPGK
jgi:hypothetical protein